MFSHILITTGRARISSTIFSDETVVLTDYLLLDTCLRKTYSTFSGPTFNVFTGAPQTTSRQRFNVATHLPFYLLLLISKVPEDQLIGLNSSDKNSYSSYIVLGGHTQQHSRVDQALLDLSLYHDTLKIIYT